MPLASGKEHGITGVQPQLGANGFHTVGFKVLGNRALATFFCKGDVTQTTSPVFTRPGVQLVIEGAGAATSTGGRNGAYFTTISRNAGKQAKAGTGKIFRYICNQQRVAQVWLIRTIHLHGAGVGNTLKRRGAHGTALAEFRKQARHHFFQNGKNFVLRGKGHFKVELVELTGGTVRAGGFITEARSNLEIAVKPGHHGKLLELLRSLRQGVKLAGMGARRH